MKYLLLITLIACGVSGYAGAPGPDGAKGATGAQGPAGTNGTNGATGPIGLTGATGAAGQAGTQVISEQFCSGYTLSYPSTFPEFGLLINGQLFAVYWDGHNSWLAEIPPGYYASTSTSAPCDFTVNADGTISQ